MHTLSPISDINIRRFIKKHGKSTLRKIYQEYTIDTSLAVLSASLDIPLEDIEELFSWVSSLYQIEE